MRRDFEMGFTCHDEYYLREATTVNAFPFASRMRFIPIFTGIPVTKEILYKINSGINATLR